jgi:hypothetical protein
MIFFVGDGEELKCDYDSFNKGSVLRCYPDDTRVSDSILQIL